MSDQTEIVASRAAAYRLIGVELALLLIISALLYAATATVPAYSAMLGGLASILPNAIFARFALRGSGQLTPQAIVTGFYLGEAVKLVATCLILAACFILVKPVHAVSLFVTYLVMVLINMAGLILIANNGGK